MKTHNGAAPDPDRHRRSPVVTRKYPELKGLITDDGAPVDSLFVERQYRLLTEPLNANWEGPKDGRPFIVMTDVGLFKEPKNPAIAPDAMLAVGVKWGENLREKQNRSYFLWLVGKPPDVVIEIVSNKRGGEETKKLKTYAEIGVPHYVIFDPDERLKNGKLRVFELIDGRYESMNKLWFPTVELGLRLWKGVYEGTKDTWLRWCYEDESVVLTGQEAKLAEKKLRQIAEQEKSRAELEKEQEKQRADQNQQRADQNQQRAEQLLAILRGLGVDPDA
jgi:Uma2 family endonuclease